MIHQEESEQPHQIADGVQKGRHGVDITVRAPKLQGEVDEPHPQHQGPSQINRTGHMPQERQQGDHQQHQGVEQDLLLGELDTVGDGQHRDAGLRVLGPAFDGQGPEVWRSPQENDHEQQQPEGTHLSRNGGPPQQWRCSPSNPSPNDILRRHPLQVAGVDHRVANEGGEGEDRGQHIHEGDQYQHGQSHQTQGEAQGVGSIQVATGQGATTGPLHDGIDALIDHMVEGRPSGGGKPDADETEHQGLHRNHPGGGQQHTHQGGEQDQGDDLGFGQVVIAPPRQVMDLTDEDLTCGHNLHL